MKLYRCLHLVVFECCVHIVPSLGQEGNTKLTYAKHKDILDATLLSFEREENKLQ